MNFKKIVALFLCFIMIVSLASCVKDGGEGTPDITDGSETPTVTDAPTTDGSEAPTDTDAPATDAPETDAPPKEIDTKKSLKILAIGNSFSVDAMEYLYQIAKNAGVEEIILGNLHYASCDLTKHYAFSSRDSAEYVYYKNTSGSWSSVKNTKMSTAIADEDWDFVSLQQASGSSGVTATYGRYLEKMIEYVQTNLPNAVLMWHATWAYQQNSTHSAFGNYGKNQKKMYDMIIDCVKTNILTHDCFKIIIPCTTSIQNARTSFLGDNLTRDGYHLDYNIGRYIAGLTWYAAITGESVENITYKPSAVSDDMMKVAKESVANAIKAPFEITQSTFKPAETEPIIPEIAPDASETYKADAALAANNGVDLSKFTLLEWDYRENSYWYGTNQANVYLPAPGSGNDKCFISSMEMYSIEDLPVGTVFILDSGWLLRIDIFPDETNKYTGSRPATSTAKFFVLSDSFLNGCKYLGWNISTNPKGNISDRYAEAASHLRVYIPNAQ